MQDGGAPLATAMSENSTTTDVTDATFQTAVLDRSKEVPVVVDLWAPWCGPCRQLGPIIEDAVAATDGQVELVKINTDENPGASQAFQVQSIPAVYAIKDGAVVDGFIGAQGSAAVSAFVNSLLPSEEETELERLVALGDEDSLRAALGLQADHPDAVVALAELLAGTGEHDEALKLLERVPESAETRRVAALARTGEDAPDDVDDELAMLIDQVKGDDEARQRFVDLLELLGPDDPRTAEWRRKLTAALY
jgi:putative thioredoxin